MLKIFSSRKFGQVFIYFNLYTVNFNLNLEINIIFLFSF